MLRTALTYENKLCSWLSCGILNAFNTLFCNLVWLIN